MLVKEILVALLSEKQTLMENVLIITLASRPGGLDAPKKTIQACILAPLIATISSETLFAVEEINIRFVEIQFRAQTIKKSW